MAQCLNLTWFMVSCRARGVGLTRVMSCAAADVMSNPADCMPGCMRGASDSKLYGDSGEGKLKELAVTTCSICSTDDCMMLARLFNSIKASWELLCKRVMVSSLTSTVLYGTCGTYLAVEGWGMDGEGKEIRSETERGIVKPDRGVELRAALEDT
jgi:hypothetical protein